MAIAVLEGTGYMARAAFVMDRFMSKVGLHGKSFIPLLIGFGCTVPAIMATRTLETRRDRLITMMVLPLMSCGARLPIYALMIPAFFAPRWQGPVLWLIYVTGILLALLGARLLRATLFRGENTPFVMELPPYRLPTGRSLLIQMWTRAWLYVQKAGTVILGASIILWCLTFYPKPHGDWVPPAEQGRPSGVAYGADDRPGATARGRTVVLGGRSRGPRDGAADQPAGLRLAHRHRAGGRDRRQGSVRGADGHRLRGRRGRRELRGPARPAARPLHAAGGPVHHDVRADRHAVHRDVRDHAPGIGFGQVGAGAEHRADGAGLDRHLCACIRAACC